MTSHFYVTDAEAFTRIEKGILKDGGEPLKTEDLALEAAVRSYRDRALTAEAKLKELQEEVDRVWRAHDQLLDLTRPK